MSGLFYREFGEGVPVVAVHGWQVDHRIMLGCLEPVFVARGGGYRRLYPDLPGLGSSDGTGVASSDDVLAALDAFIDEQVAEQPFLLIGESYGGLLARAVVNRRGTQVLGLALICPATGLPHAERRLPAREVLRCEPGVLDSLPADVAAGFAELAVVHSAETVRRFLAEVQPGLTAADPETVRRVEASYALGVDPDHAQPVYAGPTVILLGRQDVAVGYHDQLALLERYPHASLAILDVAGHNLQIEQPQLFSALLGEWLDRVATAD